MRNTWPKTPAGESVLVCTTMAARMKGLMGESDAVESGYAVLVPCRGIHTFGMDAPIDVAFVGKEGTVVASYERVPPGSRLSCRDACMAIERRVSAAAAPWFRCGSQVFALPDCPETVEDFGALGNAEVEL